MHNGLVVVTFQLVDHPLGAGGLAVVPGAILHCLSPCLRQVLGICWRRAGMTASEHEMM